MVVITGLDPVIHAFFRSDSGGAGHMDGRNRSGHDGYRLRLPSQCPYWLYRDFQPDSRGLDPGIYGSDIEVEQLGSPGQAR